MSTRLRYALFFLGAFVISLIGSMPASLAQRWLGPLPPQLELHGLSGTIWQGRAEGLVLQGRSVGALEWRLSPWSLLLAELGLEFSLYAGEEYLLGQLALSDRDDWRLSALEGELGLARLWPRIKSQLGPQLAAFPVAVEGRLRLYFDELAQGPEGLSATGRVSWLGAAAGMPEPLPLGDLSLQMQGREGRFSDGGGPLRLEGELQLSAEGAYSVDLKLAAREGAAPMLKQGLALLGPADAEGRHAYRMQGELIQF